MNLNSVSDTEKAKVLREAYRKHAQSLHDIEDTQVKLTALLLGILGAGATFIAGVKQPLLLGTRLGLTFSYHSHYVDWIHQHNISQSRAQGNAIPSRSL